MADTAIDLSAQRAHPLVGVVFAAAGVALTLAPDAYRVNLRAKPDAAGALSKALGVDLPTAPKTSASAGTRTALWLGPDEWLIYDTKANPVDALSGKDVLHSAVDISHRNTAILVSGPSAADVVNGGCPQDLSLASFPVGAASRTVLGKAEIVLHRVKPTVFRVEVWRSFSRYAFDLLEAAARDV
ncbi:MAG: sarcosine oxidase subunit gamma family protein [Ahrensia sp.]